MQSQFEEPSLEKLLGPTSASYPAGNAEVEPVSPIQAALQRHEADLMSISGVVGVGIQRDAIGDEVIVIYASDASVKTRIPKVLDGFPTRTEVSGEFFAQ